MLARYRERDGNVDNRLLLSSYQRIFRKELVEFLIISGIRGGNVSFPRQIKQRLIGGIPFHFYRNPNCLIRSGIRDISPLRNSNFC